MHRLTQFSLRRPWLTLALLLAITVGLGAGVPGIKPGYGFRVLLGGDHHPAIQRLDSLDRRNFRVDFRFTSPGNAAPATRARASSTSLAADGRRTNTQTRSDAHGARKYEAPTNAPLLVPGPEWLLVRRFVENGEMAPDAASPRQSRRRGPALAQEQARLRHGRVGVIVVQPVDNRSETDLALVDAIERALAPYRAQGISTSIRLVTRQRVILAGRALSESMGHHPILVLVIARHPASLDALLAAHPDVTLVTMGVGLLWTFGLVGWLAWPQGRHSRSTRTPDPGCGRVRCRPRVGPLRTSARRIAADGTSVQSAPCSGRTRSRPRVSHHHPHHRRRLSELYHQCTRYLRALRKSSRVRRHRVPGADLQPASHTGQCIYPLKHRASAHQPRMADVMDAGHGPHSPESPPPCYWPPVRRPVALSSARAGANCASNRTGSRSFGDKSDSPMAIREIPGRTRRCLAVRSKSTSPYHLGTSVEDPKPSQN